MTRYIWKYVVSLSSETTVPLAGTIVHVGIQSSWPMLWVEVDPSAEAVPRTFDVFGTGEPIPDGWQHRGTVQDGAFVWHVYERQP